MEFWAEASHGVHVARNRDDDGALRRACDAGRLIRLRRGAYVDADLWRTSDRSVRHLLRIKAVSASRDHRDVLSHQSAASIHGIALLHDSDLVHVTDPRARTTRTISGLRVHASPLGRGEVLARPPLRFSDPVRTVADLLLTSPFREGVAALDSALRLELVERQAVESCVAASSRIQGRATATRALAFAEAGAANPGESLSRVVIAELGFAVPVLQKPFEDRDGRIGLVDFWWEASGTVGEFDGFQKYTKAEFLRGRTPAQVAVEERRREGRLEAMSTVRRVVRWTWDDVMRPERLFRLLASAGVPRA